MLMADRFDDTVRRLLFCHLELAVHRDNDVIKRREHFVAVIKIAIRKYVALDAFQNFEILWR